MISMSNDLNELIMYILYCMGTKYEIIKDVIFI